MADSYRFSTNRKMLIDDWDECFSELTGEPASVAVGRKYYDVFPRLFFRQKDAVAYVMEKTEKACHEGARFQVSFSEYDR